MIEFIKPASKGRSMTGIQLKRSFCLSVVLLLSFSAHAKNPWANAIGLSKSPQAIGSVETRANVSVSDGLKYTTQSSWQSNDYVIFSLQYPDKTTTLGKEGLYYWSFDGKSQRDHDDKLRDFIFGHQFHAELLFPDNFVTQLTPEKRASERCECWLTKGFDLDNNAVEYHSARDSNQLIYKVVQNKKHGTITNQYLSWQKTGALTLPHEIKITHDGRVFNYAFTQISFNSDESYQQLRTAYDKLNDAQKIRRLHQDMMDAHIKSDASLMAHIWADDITIVNRGKIDTVSGKAAAEKMRQSLSMRQHSRYYDLDLPQVKLSDDKTLAYLIARIKAEGNRIGKPEETFTFVSAWLATFEKQDGIWKMTSNASNFE